jgi:hypothetical protein
LFCLHSFNSPEEIEVLRLFSVFIFSRRFKSFSLIRKVIRFDPQYPCHPGSIYSADSNSLAFS